MISSNDGKYYLDIYKKKPYGKTTHNKFTEYLFGKKGFMQVHDTFLLEENGITFKFNICWNELNAEFCSEKNGNTLRIRPIMQTLLYKKEIRKKK